LWHIDAGERGPSTPSRVLGHANIATTRIYDHRKTRPEDSPTFKVAY
jgi:integrase